MNESLYDLLSKVTGFQLVYAILLILAIVVLVMTQKKKITKLLNKWRKTKNDDEEFHALVYELKKSVEDIKGQITTLQTSREDDHTEMHSMMEKQSKSIETLTSTVISIQETNSKTTRAEIKEKIERIYNECHPAGKCTDMQKETLEDLIEEYEVHGGVNSFIHSVVQKEMYKWEVLARIGG